MYVTKSGDTWDGIAKTVYDDEMRADVLMAANREYNDVYQFDSGVQLTLSISATWCGTEFPLVRRWSAWHTKCLSVVQRSAAHTGGPVR